MSQFPIRRRMTSLGSQPNQIPSLFSSSGDVMADAIFVRILWCSVTWNVFNTFYKKPNTTLTYIHVDPNELLSSSGSSGRENLCGRIWRSSFLWLIFTRPGRGGHGHLIFVSGFKISLGRGVGGEEANLLFGQNLPKIAWKRRILDQKGEGARPKFYYVYPPLQMKELKGTKSK